MQSFGVIFDMDGVLVDTIPYNYQLWHEYLATRGIELSQHDFQQVLGMGHAEVVAAFNANLSAKLNLADVEAEINPKRTKYYNSHNLTMSEPLISLLKELWAANVPLAVATGSKQDVTQALLRHNHLASYFQAVVTLNDVEHGKPAADIYLLASQRLGLQPGKCVVIEDAQAGIASAKAAGCKVVGYVNGFNTAADVATSDVVVDNFADLSIDQLRRLTA